MTWTYSPAVSHAIPASFAPIIEEVKPNVVSIQVTSTVRSPERNQFRFDFPPGTPFEDFFRRFNTPPNEERHQQPQERERTGVGSGFFIEGDGYIVTNHHVVIGAEEIKVITDDGETLAAKLIGSDSRTDVALLKVDVRRKSYLQWGDSNKLSVGDWVLAIGNPHGLSGSVSLGIVSAKGRSISDSYDDYIQTDAAINKGNSGGPLVSSDGRVVGMNTVIFSPDGGSIGIGFAVPTTLIREVIEQLKEYGQTRRGWLGVELQEMTNDISEALGVPDGKGALISNIVPDGPADLAGIKAGDVIISFSGQEVPTLRSLPILVARAEIGSQARVTVVRNGKRLEFDVRLGHLEKALAQQEDSQEDPSLSERDDTSLGMRLRNISDSDNVPQEIREGVLIDYVDAEGKAFDAGLRPGYIITQVNNQSVRNVDSFYKLIAEAQERGNPSVAIRYFDGQSFRYIGLKIN